MVVIMQSVRIRGEFGMVCWHKAKVQLAQSRLADNLHSPSKEIFILVCRRSIVQTTHTCVIHGCLVCIHLIVLCRKDTLWLAFLVRCIHQTCEYTSLFPVIHNPQNVDNTLAGNRLSLLDQTYHKKESSFACW